MGVFSELFQNCSQESPNKSSDFSRNPSNSQQQQHLASSAYRQESRVVEGNSRFCKVALGIPKIPGNSHGFPGIPGSFGNPSPSQELKRRPPPSGELRSTGPTLNLSPRHQWRVQSMAIQKEKPKNVAKWW